jgi:predicted dehydrogenase
MGIDRVPRIAVVGGGRFGEMHLRAFTQMQSEGRAELVALVDVSESLLAERRGQYGVKTYADLRAMLTAERPDGVTVATPDHLHRRIAAEALAAGCHVLVEKPLDVTAEGCRELIAAAEAAERLLMVDFHKRYDPYHAEAAARVAAGAIGEVLYGYAHMEDRLEVPRDWFPAWAGRSSPAWFLGVHFFDLIRWICRREPVSVSATGTRKKLVSLGVDTFDAMNVKVNFDGGAGFAFDLSWVLPDGFEAVVNQGFRIVGTEGLIEIDSQDRGGRLCTAGGGMETLNMGFFKETVDPRGRRVFSGYGIESIRHFAELLGYLGEGVAPAELAGRYADGRDGLAATRITLAAHASAAEGGRLVELVAL